MFSGLTDKIKTSLGLPTFKYDGPTNPPATPEDAPSVPTPAPSEAEAEAEKAAPAAPLQPIPGSEFLEHMENRQQMLALRRRQTVMMAAKADENMTRAATECRRHLQFVSTIETELKQLPNLSAAVLKVRTDLEKLLSDCHELELAFSEISEAKVLLGLERWRDEQWDMMARFREARKQEIKALERKVHAKKDKVHQLKLEQARKQKVAAQTASAGESEDVPLPPSVATALEGNNETANVILKAEMMREEEPETPEAGIAGSLPDQLSDFVEKQEGTEGGSSRA